MFFDYEPQYDPFQSYQSLARRRRHQQLQEARRQQLLRQRELELQRARRQQLLRQRELELQEARRLQHLRQQEQELQEARRLQHLRQRQLELREAKAQAQLQALRQQEGSEEDSDDDELSAEEDTPMDAGLAAAKLQAAWRGRRVRRQRLLPKLAQLRKVGAAAAALEAKCSGRFGPFLADEALLASEPRKDKLMYDLLAFEEGMLRHLFSLDSISTGGSPVIRERRKALVASIQRALRPVDQLKAPLKKLITEEEES